MINAIEITDLKKRYGKIESLKGVNLEVPKGTIYGLIGPNGAGKTTLIKALVGIVKPTSGTMNVLGFNPSKDKWKLRKNIGYMPQESSLFETLSPRENITFFGKAQQLHGLKEKVEEIIEFTELKERADDPVHTFSGGMLDFKTYLFTSILGGGGGTSDLDIYLSLSSATDTVHLS